MCSCNFSDTGCRINSKELRHRGTAPRNCSGSHDGEAGRHRAARRKSSKTRLQRVSLADISAAYRHKPCCRHDRPLPSETDCGRSTRHIRIITAAVCDTACRRRFVARCTRIIRSAARTTTLGEYETFFRPEARIRLRGSRDDAARPARAAAAFTGVSSKLWVGCSSRQFSTLPDCI